mmetsp:Transcript_85954/g.224298  ORF Transcript_85954/g.224298 Transcript_85954/m.224298 type:complete len:283 (-) Transcript_85954:125-973(-)
MWHLLGCSFSQSISSPDQISSSRLAICGVEVGVYLPFAGAATRAPASFAMASSADHWKRRLPRRALFSMVMIAGLGSLSWAGHARLSTAAAASSASFSLKTLPRASSCFCLSFLWAFQSAQLAYPSLRHFCAHWPRVALPAASVLDLSRAWALTLAAALLLASSAILATASVTARVATRLRRAAPVAPRAWASGRASLAASSRAGAAGAAATGLSSIRAVPLSAVTAMSVSCPTGPTESNECHWTWRRGSRSSITDSLSIEALPWSTMGPCATLPTLSNECH